MWTKLSRSPLGRCLLHLAAMACGACQGHPHAGFHLRGVAREIRRMLGGRGGRPAGGRFRGSIHHYRSHPAFA